MKKILFFAATLFAAVTMSAQDPIPVTCAEAAAAMPAQSGSETEDVYIVTGFITNTNGSISPSRTDPTIDQQTFYRYYNFTEIMAETASGSLHHSCRSELTRQGISLP